MRLAFLIERRYAPGAKWFGTAIQRLRIATAISDGLKGVVSAADWREREEALIAVIKRLGEATNRLGLVDPVDPVDPVDSSVRRFYDRSYTVLDAHRFREALKRRITDPDVQGVIDQWGWVGAVDQSSDSVDLLGSTDRRQSLRPVSPEPRSVVDRL